MPTATQNQKIAGLYAAFFNRAPDQNGLNDWNTALNGGSELVDISEQFVAHPVFTAEYNGLTNQQFVEKIYVNMLGAAGDAAGIANWVAQLDAGVSKAQVVADFVSTSLTLDLDALLADGSLTQAEYDVAVQRQQTITNRADVGLAFVTKLGAASNVTSSDVDSDPAYLASIEALKGVSNTDASKAAAEKKLDDAVATGNPIFDLTGKNPSGGSGSKFTLTEKRDMKTGTDADDQFYADVAQNDNGASANALSTGDVIDGGNGVDKLYATLINDNEVDGADADLSINARTSSVEEAFLSVLDENVTVDAGRMDAVQAFWSDDSDANLVIEDVRLGTGQNATKDITFGLKDVDQNSGLSVAFDTNSLTNSGSVTTNSQLLVRIADVSTETADTPLANVNVNLSFQLGDDTVSLQNVRSTDGTYAGLVAGIKAALTTAGHSGVSVDLSTAYTQVTFADNTVNLPFTAQEILLTDPNGKAFSNVNFTQSAIQPVADGFLVAGNASPVDPSTSTTDIETNLILDNAGRGSTAGDVVIGGMSNSAKVIQKLNLTVDNSSKIDDLATASGLENNAFSNYKGFEEIEITSTGANGALSVNDIQDTATVNANAFAGSSLTINNATDLQTLNAAINGDVTVNAETKAGANVYTTGGGKDSLTVKVEGNDVNAAGEGFTANTGAGNDTVKVTMSSGVSQQTMVELDSLKINTGAGEDTVNLDAYGNFKISTGNDSDFVRFNSVDDNGNANLGTWNIGQDSGAQAFGERVLYEAKLTVTFAGFEQTVSIETTEANNFVATQSVLNAAIREAIDTNPELSKLLSYTDGNGTQQLVVKSTVGGMNDLAIDVFQPKLVVNNATAAEVDVNASHLSALRQGLIDTTALTSDDLENVAEVVAATDGLNNFFGSVDNAGAATEANAQFNNDYLGFSDGGSTDSTTGINFSSVNLGSGSNDIVVMHSNVNSANVLEVTGAFGKASVVNFHDVSPNDVGNVSEVGNHGIDFTSILDGKEDASTNIAGNQQSATGIAVTLNINPTVLTGTSPANRNNDEAHANSVNMLQYDETAANSVSFADVTAANLVAALNGTAGATVVGNLGDTSLYAEAHGAQYVGTVQKHIVMIENVQNRGEYKVFSLTSTLDAADKTKFADGSAGNQGNFDVASATLLGTLDFGASINFQLVGSNAWSVLTTGKNLDGTNDSANGLYNDFNDYSALNLGSDAVVSADIVTTSRAFNTLTGANTKDGKAASSADQVIEVADSFHLAGSTIDGGAGNNTLQFGLETAYDLTTASAINAIKTINAANAKTLTATAAQLDGLTVSNAKDVNVSALTADADLSGVTASGNVAVTLGGDLTLNGADIAGADLTVASGQTLTATTANLVTLDAGEISGAGTVVVDATADQDLTVAAAAAELAKVDTATTLNVQIDDGSSVTVTAAQHAAIDGYTAVTPSLSGDETINIDTLNGATVAATDAKDVLVFAQGDKGVTVSSFASDSGDDVLNINALLADADVAGSSYEAFSGSATATNNAIVSHDGSAALNNTTAAALFEATDSDAAKMLLANGEQAVLVFQDDSGTDFGAQVFLIDNDSGTITAELVVTLNGVADLAFADFA